VLAVLGTRARANEYFSWDSRLHEVMSSYSEPEFNEFADDVISLFLRAGVDGIALAVSAGSAYVFRASGRFRAFWFVVSSVVCAILLTFLLKSVFERSLLDPLGTYEFPSGHATRSFVAAGILVALTWRTRWRRPAAAAAALFVAAVGTSLVYAGWHLPSDVLGGWAVALAVLVAAGAVFPTSASVALPTAATQRTRG